MKSVRLSWLAALTLNLAMAMACAGDDSQLPDPDGKEADMSKPVQVFILMGQSNMVGFGKTDGLKAATGKGLYPYLVDDNGNWTVRKDVRNVKVMCSGKGASETHFNDWLSGGNGSGAGGGKFGPEIGIGYYVGEVLDAPVLILKSCIGNRSLGYDLLPPSAEGYEGAPDQRPRKPVQDDRKWYAGVQYDGDVAAAQKVLNDLGTYYPGATKYEVAGFCFWQGAKDCGKGDGAEKYEKNLVTFIKDLRKDFNAPNAMFVCATMGNGVKGGGGKAGMITDAQLAVDGKTGKYPEFKGNVATFYSNPVSKGGAANGHYGGNAETYMNVGDGMGRAMAELLKAGGAGSKKKEPRPGTKTKTTTPDVPNRPKVLTINQRAEREISSMLNYLKMVQPQVQVGDRIYRGIKIHDHLATLYKKNKAKVTSTDTFLAGLATKTGKNEIYYVIEANGSKKMLKTWFKDYLAKLRTRR